MQINHNMTQENIIAIIDMDLMDDAYPEAFAAQACHLDATERHTWDDYDVDLTIH